MIDSLFGYVIGNDHVHVRSSTILVSRDADLASN